MDKKKIAAIYELSADKVNKLLNAAGLDHQREDFTRQDLQLFEEAYVLHTEQGLSTPDVRKEIQRREEESQPRSVASNKEIDPTIMATIESQSEEMARKIAGETPEIFLEQKERIKEIMIQKFWEMFAAIAQSGELQRNFDRVMGSQNTAVIEATVLPGESPALPENSSSVT